MRTTDSPFEPKRNPFEGITEIEMARSRKIVKEKDRLFDKRIKKMMKKLRGSDQT